MIRPLSKYWFVVAWAILSATFLSIAGCSAVGVAPQTFNEKAYVAASAMSEIQNQTLTLLRAGAITPSEAEKVVEVLNDAVEALQAARGMQSVNPVDAMTKLDGTIVILTQLRAFLVSRQK